jgi:uncharacterized membrane protein YphA (DoxX/SURF4 family)
MRPNPLTDLVTFVTQPGWPAPALWALTVLALGIATVAWFGDPTRQTGRALGIAVLRFVMGAMWWQQSLWKIPPNFDGLHYWMQQEVEHAAIPLQGDLITDYVLPNLDLFGPLVYGIEVAIGVSLMLGLFSRFGALLGALMAVNLWLGLYSAPGEWPWTYGFLLIIQALFVIDPPGRALGIDAFFARPQWHGRLSA